MAKKPEAEIVVAQPQAPVVQDQSVESFISQALSSGASVETLNSLYALKERVDAANAKKAYIEAVAAFQSSSPTITKDKKVLNKDGRSVRYKFASLDSIVDQIKGALKDNHLSYRWDVMDDEQGVKVTCFVTHTLGHTESSTFTIPVDTEGYMTAPQKKASALTFAKRYSLCNALGIATADEDDDATTAKKEADAKDPKSKIINRLRALNEKTDTKEHIEDAVQRLAKLPLTEGNYDEIITRLEVVIADRHETA